ncbi:urease accessory protein UreF [Chitinophaga pendula]|uniref:urease accessory protein UreF n=1 Tax=Chitinophaga TaxID=79328 RepID=UPI000BB02E71|nr:MULTISPECIES: urease accessory protein UreF [Chitinophaga]ASZ15032.1 urease accessory protein UreF [Chitinophaga sp. MD30]UCJ09266.1 urease accessory protein UreF [Chitinophaga pendula]
MQLHHLASLLHLSDPTLPVGGYSHSAGLETYVQQRLVKDVASAEQYIRQMLQVNIRYNDAAFASLAYDAATADDITTLLLLDETAEALKAPREIRQASQKLCLRLIKIFSRQQDLPLLTAYHQTIRNGNAAGHYAIAFGAYAAAWQIPKEAALYAFYYNATVGIVTNCVKLIPLGQLDGQDMLFRLQPALQQLALATLQPDPDRLGLCSPAFDIRCMQHERLYSRLYMS